MNGSPARQPARLSGSGGHQNAAFEPDTYIEPVMIDDQPTHPKAGATQNGGRDNAGFQSGEPAVLNVNSDTNGYTGLDNTHLYQDFTPNGHSNSKPSQKNGHVPQGNAYEFEGETGQEVHEYEYPDAPVNSISGNVGKDGRPYGFGRQESYMFKGQTERDRTREEREIGKHKSHCSRICAVLVAILILIIIGAIIFVVFEFIVNKPDDVTTTTQLSPTTALPPAQIYMVTTSAVATLDLVYSTALADQNTAEYRELEANFTYSVETAFQNAEMPDVTYEGVIVNSFSSGSVVVNFDVLASHTQNTPPGQAGEQVAINAVEREVTVVLTALTEDNLSDLPFMSFNVTGSEIIVTSTPEPTTSQQPTDCFSCDSGKCIPFEEECDGENQCAFGEDERNCMQRCESFLCNDGICVANSTVCDYVDDCTGGEDESGCSYPVGEETIDIIYGDVPYPLTSYGYPAEYPNNVLYSWKFIAGTGYKIRLQFTSFSTHDANDYVLIGDGDVIGSDPFLRLYGGGFVPEEILSQGGDIWITMVTDRNFRSTGFLAHITSVLQNEVLGACAPSDMLCGNHLCIKAERLCDVTPHCVLSTFEPGCPARIDLSGTSQQYQSVTSPFLTLYSANFPALYDNDIDATVYLTAPAGQRILAATRQFDIEADYDFLTFYEGHGTGSNDQIARISGLLPNQVIMSTGNQMTIVFQSDYSFSLYGFRIEIEGQASDGSCNSDEFSCMNGQCRPNNLVCNGEIDCIDFSDEDKCPTCQPVPSECSSVLPWTTTVFPNARYQSESDALQRYAELESTALSCDPSGQLLLCAALFPECPHYGTTRNLCPSVCEAVIDNCPMLSELSNACSGSTMVDANNGNPLCEARNGDPLDTMVCGTRPGYQGDSEVQPRIIGGTYAEMGEFPWIGSLRTLRGDLQCGATLLNEYWAVTAAHCTGVYDEIVFGDIKLDTESSYSVSPIIAEIIDHPNYFSTTGGDDITLIRFSEAVVFNDYVRPICLPSNVSETQIYRRCYAAGWGVIVSDGEDASNDLLKVLLGSIENDACGKIYDDIIPSKICAGYSAGGYDSCQGDSGGPLACEGDDGRWHLVGITSYGTGCGDPGFPGVYTRVSSFLDFIEDNITPTS